MKTLPILGFDAYRISENGDLDSCWVWGPYYPGMPCEAKWKRLPLKHNSDGYIPVNLRSSGGKGRRTHIHRLVAETFISSSPFRGACVRHLNGNPKDNSISNLAWGTYLDNENDKIRHGTNRKKIK